MTGLHNSASILGTSRDLVNRLVGVPRSTNTAQDHSDIPAMEWAPLSDVEPPAENSLPPLFRTCVSILVVVTSLSSHSS